MIENNIWSEFTRTSRSLLPDNLTTYLHRCNSSFSPYSRWININEKKQNDEVTPWRKFMKISKSSHELCRNFKLTMYGTFDHPTSQLQVARDRVSSLAGRHSIFRIGPAKYGHLRWTCSSKAELLSTREQEDPVLLNRTVGIFLQIGSF